MTVCNIHKLSIFTPYQSDRPVTSYDRFIGPLVQLASRGHEVQVISNAAIEARTNLMYHRARNLPFPLVPSLPFLVQSLFVTLFTLRRHNIRLWLVYREEDLLVAWLARRLTKCKIVYYAHGDAITIQQLASRSIIGRVKTYLAKSIEKLFLPRIDLVIAVSQDTKSRFLRRLHMNSEKIVVLHNNVMTYHLGLTRPLKRLKEEDRRLIGYVGHFSPLKGVDTILHAFSLLAKTFDDLILILVGDGPTRNHLEDLSTMLGIRDRVVFTGWVRNPLDYMRDLDILVVSSYYEGCPSVILESLALGIPVLGSNAGGIPELLGFDELLFHPGNHDELYFKLRKFLESERNYHHLKRLTVNRRETFTFDHTSTLEYLLQLSTGIAH